MVTSLITALVIVGSPRKDSNTLLLAERAVELLTENGVKAELINLRELKIHDCTGCRKCLEMGNCCINDDMTNKVIPSLLKSQIVIIATPVHFDNVSALIKRFMDRTWCIRGKLKDKVLGAIVVGRGYGLDTALTNIHNWALKHRMIIGDRGVMARAFNYGEVLKDLRALKDLEKHIKRLAELSRKLSIKS